MGSGGTKGRLEGTAASLSEASSPLSEEIVGFCWRKFGKIMYETAFLAITAPQSEVPAPSMGRSLAPPLIIGQDFL